MFRRHHSKRKLDHEAFVRTVRDAQEKQSTSDILKLKQTVEADNRRLDELETLICRIYEDNILGKLPDDRYMFLSASYEAERKKLSEEVLFLRESHQRNLLKETRKPSGVTS